jgi:hypothetical protein
MVDSIAAVALSRAEFSQGKRGPALDRLRVVAQREPARAGDVVLAYADLLAQAGDQARGADVAVRQLTLMTSAQVSILPTSSLLEQALQLTHGFGPESACVRAVKTAHAPI